MPTKKQTLIIAIIKIISITISITNTTAIKQLYALGPIFSNSDGLSSLKAVSLLELFLSPF